MRLIRTAGWITVMGSLLAAALVIGGAVIATADSPRVEVVDLRLDQAPTDGGRVTARLTMKSSGAPVTVYWEIREAGSPQPLGSGRPRLPTGVTTVTATWVARAGQHVLQGTVQIVTAKGLTPPMGKTLALTVPASAPAGASAAARAPAQRAPMASQTERARVDLNKARVDASQMKQNLKGQTENSGLSTSIDKDTKGPFAGMKGEQGNTLPQGTFVDPSKVTSGESKAISNAVGGKPVITGGRYGDTFGADRINRGTTGSVNDYRGGGQGNASDSDVDQLTAAIAGIVADMVRAEGGTPSGDVTRDLQEVAYAQKVGTDGYAATKDLTWTQRSNYWNAQSIIQRSGSGPKTRPREDDAGTGQWKPVTRSDLVNMLNAIRARMNKAGGGDDPRTDTTRGGGGPMARVAGKDDAPAKERALGAINLDKVLEINQKINPQR